MRRYRATVVKIGKVLEFMVEMWTENNHSTIFNELGECLFDGYFCDAYVKYNEQVENLIKMAEKSKMPYEVTNR